MRISAVLANRRSKAAFGLQAPERSSHTGVRPPTECQMVAYVRATRVEVLRLVEMPGVVARGCQAQCENRPRGYLHAANRGLLARQTVNDLYWGIEAEDFLEKYGNASRVGAQLLL